MAGFILRNTLSEHGGVTRGICYVGRDGYLTRVVETKHVMPQPHGAAALRPDGSLQPLDPDSFVSMNMWGMTPEFLQELEWGLPGLLPDGRHSGPTGGIFNSHFCRPAAAGREGNRAGIAHCGQMVWRHLPGGQAPGGRGVPQPHSRRGVRRGFVCGFAKRRRLRRRV